MSHQAVIREEELKNRVAALFFGKYDCTRIVGNIDFCMTPKRRDPRQMMFIPDTPILWAEAKNHPTDVYRMLAQLILTIGRAACPHAADTRRVEDNAPYQSELVIGIENGKCKVENDGSRALRDTSILHSSFSILHFSLAARAVLDAGRELWKYYHAQPDANPNASYYDIRAHFQGCKPNGAMNAKSNDATYNALVFALRTAHKALAAQIEPKVYEYGFLKR